jgi:tetratricopeptide (TPR) repeat protein
MADQTTIAEERTGTLSVDLAALAGDPENPVLLHRVGLALGDLGQLDLALGLLGQAIARSSAVAEYHESFGGALLAAGHPAEARESFEEALRLDPSRVGSRAALAELFLDQGDRESARTLLAPIDPRGRTATRALGRLAALEGRWAEATECLLRHLRDEPADAPALFTLGVALQAQELPEPAVASYRQAIHHDPALFEAHANLSIVLGSLGRHEEALSHAEEAVRLVPGRSGSYLNRANARRDLGDWPGAIADLRKAIGLAPDYAEAWSSLGNLYHDLGELSQAFDAHDRAVGLAPGLAQAHWNRSFTLLAAGRLAEGWDEYRWRRSTAAARPEPRAFPWPEWSGEPVAGRRLLVWREQGLGDELLFLGCLSDLLRAGAQVTVVVSPRLATIVERSFPGLAVRPDLPGAVSDGERFDWQVPMASLPRWLRRCRSDFPGAPERLVADIGQRAKWAERLATLGPGRRIGICWRSGLVTPERRRHYAELSAWRPLLARPGIQWINLQYDECEAELAELGAAWGVRVHRWADEDLRDDLESVFGLVSSLDAVVTAPTAVSSIAGSLGVPTWQVDSGSDWTALGEERSPWFPSIRVVSRRSEEPDWGRVMAVVAGEVAG